LRSTWTNSSRDPIPKITRAKWTGGVAQALEYLLCKHEAKCKPQSRQKQKTKSIGFSAMVLSQLGNTKKEKNEPEALN
jgi:hypothetical protein